MIALIKSNGKKIGEIFHKGKVFSVSYVDRKSEDGVYLAQLIAKYKKDSLEIFDTTNTPGSLITSKLARSELETFLILERGLPGLTVDIENGLKKKAIETPRNTVS